MCCMCVCVCERAHTRSCVYHHEMYHSSSGLHGDGKLASFQDVARAGLARTVYIYVYIHRIFGDFQAKNTVCTPYIYGSGQNHTYIRYFGQENHQIYGHMRCIYTVLANPIYIRCIYGIFGREITKYTVICSVYTRFGPTLRVSGVVNHVLHHLTWVQLRHIKL